MKNEVYKPFVSDIVIKKKQTFLKSFHGVEPHLEFGRPDNLFDENDQIVIDLAGEIKLSMFLKLSKKGLRRN